MTYSDGYTGFFGGIANWWTGNTDWERQLISQQNQMNFNAAEAEKSRRWQEEMSNSAYQRAVADVKKAGLNPYAVLSSGHGASTPNGAVASAGAGGSATSSGGRGAGQLLSSAASMILGGAKLATSVSATSAYQQGMIAGLGRRVDRLSRRW